MKTLALLAASILFTVAPLSATEAKGTIKRSSTAKAAATQPKPRAAGVVRWQVVYDRPCDSTACRPVRFAWSPTAPGS